MTHFYEDFRKQADMIRLTDAERESIRARVLGMPASQAVRSPYVAFSHFPYSRGIAFALSLVLVVGGTGGTLYAAEGSLPGDILYGVKTGITEPIAGALAVSEEAEVRFHEDIATKRLSEAEALAEEGRLTDDVSASLSASFAEHASKIERDDDESDASSLAMDSSEAEEASEAQSAKEDAKKRFRALVAAKSASILEASGKSEREGRVASANFVLAVLGEDDASEGSARFGARMGTQPAAAEDEPEAAMLMMAPANDSSSGRTALSTSAKMAAGENDGQDLSALAAEAKRSFEEARDAAEHGGSSDADTRVSILLRMLVKADAEALTGASVSARERYLEVIDRSRNIRSLSGLPSEDDARRESGPGGGSRSGEDEDGFGGIHFD